MDSIMAGTLVTSDPKTFGERTVLESEFEVPIV